ncbi:hypothetical protein PCASD_08181 [Puccinia coronata f. sp. avenae]|uniref:Reverse transcriptase Ty1/copia-type domain-containing protein n=1 Tax=Puccinia coronata f. sp. avenae TaxID=200324 RepID=A0A2N5VC55_9BASI|nr:hypothetical protein PCASD_08181 [Puccinia coronata f. sp. avenae]
MVKLPWPVQSLPPTPDQIQTSSVPSAPGVIPTPHQLSSPVPDHSGHPSPAAPVHASNPRNSTDPLPPGLAPSPPVERADPVPPPTAPPPPAKPTCKSNRTRRPPDRYSSWAKSANTGDDLDRPKTWRQLLKSPSKAKWLKAADEEFSSLLGMETWRLVPRPEKCKVIKSKWGIDYNKVFAPTLRQETFRLLCSLLAIRKWEGCQVDFKTAFLNGRLSEPVYMEQPQGFEDPSHPDWVFGKPTFVGPLIDCLGKRFNIDANDELHHFLSLKIDWDIDQQLIYLSQAHYIEDMQKRFLANDPTTAPTPTDLLFKELVQRKPDKAKTSGPYNQLIGSLLWAVQCTRPNISFAISRLSQFLRNPSDAHWKAGLRVLKYLVATKHLRLCLGGSLTCSGYSDSDWAEDREDRRSTSAYTFRLGNVAISWKSCKQATVLPSSTEAEYKAMSNSCKEGLWLRKLLSELCLQPKAALPLHVDNEGAEALAKNPEHHTRTKHIDARYHFVRHCVRRKRLSILHVSPKEILADMLTKPLACVQLESHRLCFGIV